MNNSFLKSNIFLASILLSY